MLTNRNSPKEKRQANSPLPKPPDLTPDDMYAKVLKKRKSENDWCNSRDSVFLSDSDPVSSLGYHPGPSNVDTGLLKSDHESYGNDGDEDDADKYACGYETLPERKYVSKIVSPYFPKIFLKFVPNFPHVKDC